MLKKITALLIFSSFTGAVALKAEPTPAPAPNSKRQSSKKIKKPLPQIIPSQPLPEGWSLVAGVWMHSDGYKFVQGQVVRTGTQTHKRPPKPPTKAEMEAATKKKKAPLTPAEIAAEKAAERQRNIRPLPSRQTGTNL